MRTLEDTIKLLPDLFDSDPDSNNYKVIEIFHEIFSELATIAQQIKDVKDIMNVSGYNLELWALDYGLTRDGNSDDELRIRQSAKLSNQYVGVTIPGILSILSAFVDPLEDLILTERSNPDLGILWNGDHSWDGTQTWSGSGSILWRAFDVDLDAISGMYDPVLGAAIDSMKEFIKPAGMNMTVDYF